MYKKVETTPEIILDNDAKAKPIATLKNEYGGVCQISIDDHCYKLTLRQSNGKYRTTPYIFPEAFEVLKTLPSLTLP